MNSSPRPSDRHEQVAATVEERLDRIERAVKTMAWWLVQAQTGFGVQDARGIEDILAGQRKEDDAVT